MIAPCHFGMEAVLKREILDLGYEISQAEEGKILYQSDLCGWVGQIGYDRYDQIYGANIYEAGEEEQLYAAGFYATEKDTSYEIYVAVTDGEVYIGPDGRNWESAEGQYK